MRGIAFAAAWFFSAAFAVSAATLEDRLAPCLACHGEKGQSATADVPSLGGQPAFYLTVQLVMFRERMRVVEPMTEQMKGVSNDELRAMADFIANLPPPQPVAGPTNPARMEHARALFQRHRCNFCHSGNFAGQENVPRLAAQREDYLIKALRGYKDNTRHGYDASMSDVIYPLTDEDLRDLAYFLARVR